MQLVEWLEYGVWYKFLFWFSWKKTTRFKFNVEIKNEKKQTHLWGFAEWEIGIKLGLECERQVLWSSRVDDQGNAEGISRWKNRNIRIIWETVEEKWRWNL